ncbi:MAG: four helix bundle protein [Candidatus Sungbacteria bacterium]|nr:four helix bundle protein [Candidatus Sungbacteria bacterium]
MTIQSYKELIVWQKSIVLTKMIYHATEIFPKAEMFGLTSQIRRATVAIPSNIAEGFSRKHRREYRQFLLIAFSSAAELETQLIISRDLDFMKDDEFSKVGALLEEIRKMLHKMISTLSQGIS